MTSGPISSERNYAAIANRYARDVVAGKRPVCRWIHLACERHIADRERKDFRFKFDHDAANRLCGFAEKMPHIRGRWRSRTIVLEPWQCFQFCSIFGWLDREAKTRRFRKALNVLPRKNSKSTCAAIVGNYMLAADGEPGAEVYSAATTRDQAKISWDVARRMAQRSPDFCARFGVEALAHSIAIEQTASFFKPLSRDADSLEGLNPHCWIVDELHAHKTREVFDVLDEATGSRRQPLGYIISTEGDNPNGVLAEQISYAQQILEGRHSDDSYFALLYTIDPEDDWTDPAAWRKANPNLGVSVLEEDLEIRCKQAQKNPASQSSFLTKRLNVRVGASDAFFNMLAWNTICKNEKLAIEDLAGQRCVIALDLASKSDIAAKVTLFDSGAVFASCYLPEDALDRGNPNYDVYRAWADQGYLTLTPGNETDFEFIERDLLEDVRTFAVRHVAYDVFQARQFSQRMRAAGLPMIEVGQTVKMLNEPMQDLAARIVAGKIQHDGNPALAWMISNVSAKKDAKDNVFPRKSLDRNENKIDAAMSLIMARAAQMLETQRDSVYNNPLTCAI